MNRKTLVHKKFGNLTVLKKLRLSTGTSNDTRYLCMCDCGKTVSIRYCNLQSGQTKSCGCFRRKKISKLKRKSAKEVVLRAAFNYYKRNAKNRHILWNLTFEQFKILVLDKCYYCHKEKSNSGKTSKGVRVKYNGIDRVDSKKSYDIENSVPCCKICNRAKGNMPKKEYTEWLKQIGTLYGTMVYK